LTKTSAAAAAAAAVIAAAALATGVAGCGTISGSDARNAGSPGRGAGGAVASLGADDSGSGSGAGRNGTASLVASLLQEGIGQAGQHQWQAADTTFQDVLAVSPRNVYALYNLGLVDQSTGSDAQAAGYYNQALKADGDYTPAMFNLAITQESSQPGQAIGLYQKIIAINPKASTAYLRLAFAEARQGNTAEAKKNDAAAIAIDPTLGKYPLPARQK
jgi:tetratricopeptide (TPR) repeat protein